MKKWWKGKKMHYKNIFDGNTHFHNLFITTYQIDASIQIHETSVTKKNTALASHKTAVKQQTAKA